MSPTPVKPVVQNYAIFTQGKNSASQEKTPKRPKPDHPNSPANDNQLKEVMNAIETGHKEVKEMFSKLNSHLDLLREDLTGKISKLETKTAERLADIQDEQAQTSRTVDVHDKSIDILKCRVNEIEQEKLANQMEIVGCSPEDIEKNKNSLLDFTAATINTFASDFEKSSLHNVFVRKIRNSEKSVIVAIFKDTSKKLEVIDKKRKHNETTRIYFNDRLTSTTRALFMKAREAATAAGYKRATVINGKVVMFKEDGTRRKICWFDDIPNSSVL